MINHSSLPRTNQHISFGSFFKLLRERSGYSARGLSTACGLSPSYVSKIESGDLMPGLDMFAKLVKQLGCSSAEILFLLGSAGQHEG